MKEKIRVIIADDNKGFCELLNKCLNKYEKIEILGNAYTDEEEISLIEKLKPEIVVTDLMRNHKYSGLEIIKKYNNMENSPIFLVISAMPEKYIINEKNYTIIGGYIEKYLINFDFVANKIIEIYHRFF